MSKKRGISTDLEKAIADMLRVTIADPEASLDAKMKVIDRALKLEALRLKDEGSDWGTGFMNDDDE
jgi:hypothetical protein